MPMPPKQEKYRKVFDEIGGGGHSGRNETFLAISDYSKNTLLNSFFIRLHPRVPKPYYCPSI